jgi:hypothetical protein
MSRQSHPAQLKSLAPADDRSGPWAKHWSCKRHYHSALANATYSITSSAPTRIGRGMVRPSALAVLRLISR